MAIGRTNAGGGGSVGILTVIAPAGATVTISKDSKTYTKTANADGAAVFKGLSTGTWSVMIKDGEKEAGPWEVGVIADYSITVNFFQGIIETIYPAGSICTCTDGTTTLTAPDTSGSHTFVVPNAGTWTVSCTDGTDTASKDVSITTDGQSESVSLSYYIPFLESNWKKSYAYRSDSYSRGTFGFSETTFTGNVNGDFKDASIVSNEKYDLSDVNTITAKVALSAALGDNGAAHIAVSSVAYIEDSSGNDKYVAIKRITSKTTNSDVSLDVSGLTGSYYLLVGIATWADAGIVTFTVSDLAFE